jgi:hypothetical protein
MELQPIAARVSRGAKLGPLLLQPASNFLIAEIFIGRMHTRLAYHICYHLIASRLHCRWSEVALYRQRSGALHLLRSAILRVTTDIKFVQGSGYVCLSRYG